jgi:hypothetical protein
LEGKGVGASCLTLPVLFSRCLPVPSQPAADRRQTLVMHRSDLDVQGLLQACQHLSYLPWHMLAGRPDPGLLLGKPAPEVGAWTGQYDALASQHASLRRRIAAQAAAFLPAALKTLIGSTTVGGEAGQRAEAGGGSDRKQDEGREGESPGPSAPSSDEQLAEALRHTWTTARRPVKQLLAALVQNRLNAAAIRSAQLARAGGGLQDGPEHEAAQAELQAAAMSTVLLTRLMPPAFGLAAVRQLFCIMRCLGQPLPAAAISGLQQWSSSLGPSSGYELETVAQILAVEGVQPPEAWSKAVFKALYACMVVDSVGPESVIRYFRLMHALGYKPDSAWWDRTLQQIYFNSSRPSSQMTGAQLQQLREAVAAVSRPSS